MRNIFGKFLKNAEYFCRIEIQALSLHSCFDVLSFFYFQHVFSIKCCIFQIISPKLALSLFFSINFTKKLSVWSQKATFRQQIQIFSKNTSEKMMSSCHQIQPKFWSQKNNEWEGNNWLVPTSWWTIIIPFEILVPFENWASTIKLN